MIRSVNPTTGETLRTYRELNQAETEGRLDLAWKASGAWRRSPLVERARRLRSAAELLRAKKAEHARLMTEEMGKPIREAEAEVEKCALTSEYFAEHAGEFLAPEPRRSDARESFVRFDPLGPVLAIMPWNFPFWQVFRFAAPALAAGNTVLLKHASGVPGCALALEALFQAAGFPAGTFQALLLPSSRAVELIADPRIRGVTLTGSDRAGREVGEAAGRAIKKVVLELGGSDPFLVLSDADLEAAARTAVAARTINSGQSCIAAKRFIVHRLRLREFEERFRAGLERLKVGNPLERDTQVGPLAREDLVENLTRQVEESVRQGARLLCGVGRMPGPGFFFAPTALSGVEPGMPAAEEETFGPVAAILPAADDDQAVEIANRTRYGLGASVWTRDVENGKELAARLEAGSVFINGQVRSDPRLPFGGVKSSGHGRELSREGIREFVNIKTVWVD